MKNPGTETSESEAIRSDIEHTRESMDRTIDKISDRMRPRALLDQLLDFFRSRDGRMATVTTGSMLTTVGKGAGRAATGMAKVVRRYPVPSLLIGAGITWAVVENRRRHRGNGHEESTYHKSAYGEEVTGKEWEEAEEFGEGEEFHVAEVEAGPNVSTGGGEKVTGIGEKISSAKASAGKAMKEKTQKLKETTQKVGQRISQSARAVGRTAQRGYTTSRTKFVEASDEYPIAMGVGFLAAGVLLGLALPHSRKEDEWMGPAADRTKQQAKQRIRSKAQDLYERGKQVASAATSAASEAVKGATPQGAEQPGQQPAPAQQPGMSGQPGCC
ncbi:MAG TPA: DUF3618 domain-containing protein [Verrucomicrobiae bacterium]|nr:DUF3618 domain-containing protein [Verrucomicrobiae bacterium]